MLCLGLMRGALRHWGMMVSGRGVIRVTVTAVITITIITVAIAIAIIMIVIYPYWEQGNT